MDLFKLNTWNKALQFIRIIRKIKNEWEFISQLNSILISLFYGQIAIYDDKKLRYTIFERNMFKEFVENIFNEISRMVKNHFIKILFKGDIFIGGKRKIIMLKWTIGLDYDFFEVKTDLNKLYQLVYLNTLVFI